MVYRLLGNTGLKVSAIGYGAFKIGRNRKTKYPKDYALPDPVSIRKILKTAIDLGINYIDTAPAYGKSEEHIGTCLGNLRKSLVVSTKVGEQFVKNNSIYDFSKKAVAQSIYSSLKKLRTDYLDIVFIHSNGNDAEIIEKTDVVEILKKFQNDGIIRCVGMSCKTREGVTAAMPWSNVLMLEYNLDQLMFEADIHRAFEKGIGVVIKKGLGSGNLPPEKAIRFVLNHSGVNSLLIATTNCQHLKENVEYAELTSK
jgi:aryl-alcohol dehydrogenase-like predicted oxidoreductase